MHFASTFTIKYFMGKGRFPMTMLLGVAAIMLSRIELNHEKLSKDDEAWIKQEMQQKKDRLRELVKLINLSMEDPDTETPVNVAEIKEAISEVAQLPEHDIGLAIDTAANAIVYNIDYCFRKLASEGGLNRENAELLSEMANNQTTELLHDVGLYGEDLQKIHKILDTKVEKSKSILSHRLTQQCSKALSLMNQARAQIPLIIISGILSAFYGVVLSHKAKYVSQLISFVYSKLVNQETDKTIGSILNDYLFAEIISQLALFVSNKTKSLGTIDFVLRIKTELFRSFVSQDMSYFEQRDLLEIRSTISSAEYTLESMFEVPINLITRISSFSTSMGILFNKSPKLMLSMCLLLPLQYVIQEQLEWIQKRMMQVLKVKNGYVPAYDFRDTWVTLSSAAGLRTLKSFSRETKETTLYAQRIKALARQNMNESNLYSWFSLFQSLLDRGVDVAGMMISGQIALGGGIDPADISMLISTATNAFETALIIYHSITGVGQYGGDLEGIEKIYDILHTVPEIGIEHPPLSDMPRDDNSVDWSFTFRNVCFAYPTRPTIRVLKNINFHVTQGERIGILGESGCGKSTLISLILHFYNTTSGEILLGGRALSEYNPQWLRRKIAVVSQQIYLPFRTVKQNLMYGISEVEDSPELEARMRRALKLASCEDLFFDTKRFPHQWHTDIGRDGSMLSGGEKQRLSVARALLQMPRILLMDEATSALDEQSQYEIQEAIQYLYEESGRELTIITIAHRLSNFRHVDRLIVFDQGRIVEEGKPLELAAIPNGIFANYLEKSNLHFQDHI